MLLIAKANDNVAGFTSVLFESPQSVFGDSSHSDIAGNYLSGVAITDQFKNQGLYRQMLTVAVKEGLDRKLPLVFTRTQNPIIEQGLIHELQNRKDRGEIAEFEIERMVVEKCYGEMLTREVPPAVANKELQKKYDKLDRNKGDAFVLLFHLTHPRL